MANYDLEMMREMQRIRANQVAMYKELAALRKQTDQVTKEFERITDTMGRMADSLELLIGAVSTANGNVLAPKTEEIREKMG